MVNLAFRRLGLAAALFTILAGSVEAQRSRTGVKRGPWTNKTDCPEGWVLHKTRNYQIQSQCSLEKAERLGKHMEALNLVYRDLFRKGNGSSKPQVIKLLKDQKEYHRYGGPGGSAAYYARGHREMVCYDTGLWSDETPTSAAITGDDAKAVLARKLARRREMFTMDILGCASHEGWHQYFSWLVGSYVELPSWINEGMGDYFYTARPHEKPTRRNPAALGGMNRSRLPTVKAAVKQGRYVPIPELIHYTKSQYYSNPSICYSQGWALCQFLLHSDNKRYREVIPTFITLVKNDTNMETVTNKAFKGIDLEQLDAEFVAYVNAMQLPGGEDKEEDKGDGVGDGPDGKSGD